MAYTLSGEFWTFSKRKNSTKRPAASGTVFNYCLKDVTSVLSPTLEIHDASVLAYNYCYLQQFGRYYWVGDKRSIAYNTYEVDLEVDVPGSWGADTYGQSVMAQMSASFYDTELDDDRVQPIDLLPSGGYASKTLEIFPSSYRTYTLLSLVTGTAGNFGGIDVFTDLDASQSNVLALIDTLFDPSAWQRVQDAVLKNDPLQVLTGIWAVPFIPAQCHGVSQHVRTLTLGLANPAMVTGYALDGPKVLPHSDSIAIPQPTVTDFRYSDRFCKYYVNIPYLGVVTIPTSLVKKDPTLYYEYSADAVSGMYSITLKCAGVYLGTYSTTLKTDLSLVSQPSTGASAISGGILGAGATAIAGAATGGWRAALIGGIAGAAAGAFRGAMNTPDIQQVSSASGSLAPAARDNFRDLEVILLEGDSSVDPATFAATVGRPTQKVVQLAAGIGYIQAANASVSFAGYRSEIDAMNALLDGGVYYE